MLEVNIRTATAIPKLSARDVSNSRAWAPMFSRTIEISLLPGLAMVSVVVWRALSSKGSAIRAISLASLLTAAASCVVSGLATGVLKVAGCAHVVLVDSAVKKPSALVQTVGEWALQSHVFAWQFAV